MALERTITSVTSREISNAEYNNWKLNFTVEAKSENEKTIAISGSIPGQEKTLYANYNGTTTQIQFNPGSAWDFDVAQNIIEEIDVILAEPTE